MCKNKLFRLSPLLDIRIYVLKCVLRFKCVEINCSAYLFLFICFFYITLFLHFVSFCLFFSNTQVKLDKFHFTCGRVRRCVKLKDFFISRIFLQVGSFTSRIFLQVGSFLMNLFVSTTTLCLFIYFLLVSVYFIFQIDPT
jgi:hypothetical protein